MRFDLARLAWADELLGKLDIDPSLFAPLIANGAVVGRVHKAGAAETGLPEGLTVSAGGHDHVISTVAADIECAGHIARQHGHGGGSGSRQ